MVVAYRVIAFAASLIMMVASLHAAAQNAAAPPPSVDPKADAILRKMSQTLANAKQFTFESEDMIDQPLDDGQKVHVAKTVKVAVRRPDCVAAEVTGDNEDVRYCYKGNQMTLINLREKCYTQQQVPDNIDEMFDFLALNYGLTPPLADLMFADPHKAMTERLRTGRYLGIHNVMGVKCHHLAFRQEGIDWQIWIEDSERAVPRKVVITYKELPGYPQFIALLNKWDLDAKLPDSTFSMSAPTDCKRVDLVPVQRGDQPAPAR